MASWFFTPFKKTVCLVARSLFLLLSRRSFFSPYWHGAVICSRSVRESIHVVRLKPPPALRIDAKRENYPHMFKHTYIKTTARHSLGAITRAARCWLLSARLASIHGRSSWSCHTTRPFFPVLTTNTAVFPGTTNQRGRSS